MIGVLIFPDFQLLDAAGPISVFEIAARFSGADPVDQDAGGDAGPGAQHLGRRDAGAGLAAFQRDHDPDRRGRRGRAHGGGLPEDAGLRARVGQARRPRRQRLLRRLRSGRGRPARRPPRHHALAAHAALRLGLSEGEAGSRPDLHARRQYLDLGRDHRGHRSCAGHGRRGFRRRDRAEDRTSSSCCTTAAAAASRNSLRCWN